MTIVTDAKLMEVTAQSGMSEALTIANSHSQHTCNVRTGCLYAKKARKPPTPMTPEERTEGQGRFIFAFAGIVRDRAQHGFTTQEISYGGIEGVAEIAQAGTYPSRAAHFPEQVDLVAAIHLGLQLADPASKFRARNFSFVPHNRPYLGSEDREGAFKAVHANSVKRGFSDLVLAVDGFYSTTVRDPDGSERKVNQKASRPIAVTPIMPPYGPRATTLEIRNRSVPGLMEKAAVDAIDKLMRTVACAADALASHGHALAAKKLTELPLMLSSFEFGASRVFHDRGKPAALEWLFDPVRSMDLQNLLTNRNVAHPVIFSLDELGTSTAYDPQYVTGPQHAFDGRLTVHDRGVFAREQQVDTLLEAWRDVTQHQRGTAEHERARQFLGHKTLGEQLGYRFATAETPLTLQASGSTSRVVRTLHTLAIAQIPAGARPHLFATYTRTPEAATPLQMVAFSYIVSRRARKICRERWLADAMIGSEMKGRGTFNAQWTSLAIAANNVYLEGLFDS